MPSRKFDREKIEGSLLACLLEIQRGRPDKIPKGHLTCDQWAKTWKLSRHKALRLLQAGKKVGKVKTVKYRINTGKKVFPVVHYYASAGASKFGGMP